MTEENKNQPEGQGVQSGDIARRDFVGLSVAAAGVAATSGSAEAAGLEVEETDVLVKTLDGMCDAAFIHPKKGAHPGVLLWPDAFGLRPSLRAMGRRLAAEGYAVLIPNPFYRLTKAPFTDASTFNFATDGGKIQPLMASVNAPGNAEKDAIAYVRKNYCTSAVESSTQTAFLSEHFGVAPAKGAKSGFTSGSSKTSAQGGQGSYRCVESPACIWG